jgi:ech hydrogenase subunit A
MTKWLSIEAAVHLPIVLVLIILGSAFTVFFWAKWIGIILTMSYKTSLRVEKLRASVRTALTILSLFVLSASILIVPLFNTFVAPQLSMDALGDATTLTSGNGGIWLGNGNVLHMGGFASIGFFIVLFAIVLTIPIFIRRTRPEKIKPPYMGGENVNDDIRGIEFMGPADKVESVIVHNYYFKNLLGEERLTLVVNLIAGAIILIMFGVVI